MNKIAIAQIDTIAGDIYFNKNKIIECIKKAQAAAADLLIFPAFALTGFPFGSILKRNKSIIEKQEAALKEIASASKNISAVIGFAENENSAAAVIQNGEIIRNPEIFELNGIKYGIQLSEISDAAKFEADAADLTAKYKPDAVICCACTPSRCGSEYITNMLIQSAAKKYRINYIYVNKAGYADDLVFEGASRIYGRNGELSLRLKSFDEDFAAAENFKGVINELPEGAEQKFDIENFKLNYKNDLARTYKSIVYAIKQYFSKNGFSKAVLGLSGGLDSSVCAVLLSCALGAENVTGVSMPSKITSKESRDDAAILAENLGINFLEIPITPVLDVMKPMLSSAYDSINAERYEHSAALENLQARARASILWSISNEFKGMLPIASSDKSEAYLGYATVNGDMSGGFAPIADVSKTKLFMLADYLNKNSEFKNAVPLSVLEKPPGAELKINPETGKPVYAEEDNMPYEFLDEIIHLAENKGAGRKELAAHKFLYENKHSITQTQKEEWIDKFFWKSRAAVYKWHIMPPSAAADAHSINSAEYRCPVISKVY